MRIGLQEGKRILAMLLAVCLVWTSCPMEMYATETSNSLSVQDTRVGSNTINISTTWDSSATISDVSIIGGSSAENPVVITVVDNVTVNGTLTIESGYVTFTGGGTLSWSSASTNAIIVNEGATVVFENITLEGNAARFSASALLLYGNVTFGAGTLIQNFYSTGGSGSYAGAKGVIAVYGKGSLAILDGAKITRNQSDKGIIAIYQYDTGGGESTASVKMYGGEITGNTVNNSNMGVVWNWYGTLEISGGIVTAAGSEYAVLTQGNAGLYDATTTISGGTFDGPTLGAVCAGKDSTNNSKITITGGIFKGNVAATVNYGVINVEGGSYEGSSYALKTNSGSLNVSSGEFLGGVAAYNGNVTTLTQKVIVGDDTTNIANWDRTTSLNTYKYVAIGEIPLTGHVCSFGDVWVTDANQHWHECVCGAKAEVANHAFGDWVSDKENKSRECGNCRYTETEKSSYTITLHTGAGTLTDTAYTEAGAGVYKGSYTCGTVLMLPTPIAPEKMYFDGWYTSADGSGSKINEISATDYDNKEYYAKWDNYEVKYESAKGVWKMGSFADAADICDGGTIVLMQDIVLDGTWSIGKDITIASDGAYTLSGEGIEVTETGVLRLKDEDLTIETKGDYGIILEGKLVLSGNPQIKTEGTDIYQKSDTAQICVDGELADATVFSVETVGIEPGRLVGDTVISDVAAHFINKNTDYILGQNANNQLVWQKCVTITPDAGQFKYEGAQEPIFTYVSSELRLSLTGALGRQGGEAVGVYTYTIGSLSAGDGYALSIHANSPVFEIVKDEEAPQLGTPTISLDTENQRMIVTIVVTDNFSGIDKAQTTLTVEGKAVDYTLKETDTGWELQFERTTDADYILTVTDKEGNHAMLTLESDREFYLLTYDMGMQSSMTTPEAKMKWGGQTITLLVPTDETEKYEFIGWEYDGSLYVPGDEFVMPEKDVCLHAKWARIEVRTDIKGSVTFENDTIAETAKVQLWKDNTLVQETQVSKDGSFRFLAVSNGSYNLKAVVENEDGVLQTTEMDIVLIEDMIMIDNSPCTKVPLVIQKTQKIKDLEQAIETILPGVSSSQIQGIWEDGNQTQKDDMTNKLQIKSNDILDVNAIYHDCTELEQKQLEMESRLKLDWILRIYGEISIKVVALTEKLSISNCEEMLSLVITEEDLQKKVNDKQDIVITLHYDEINQKAVLDETIKEHIDGIQAKKGQRTIGDFYDITIIKQIGKESQYIRKVPKKIEIIFEIPKNMQKGRDYVVLRNHDGEVTELETRQEGNRLYVQSDLFSVYAIAYVPLPEEPSAGNGQNQGFIYDASVSVSAPKLDEVPKTGEEPVCVPQRMNEILPWQEIREDQTCRKKEEE